MTRIRAGASAARDTQELPAVALRTPFPSDPFGVRCARRWSSRNSIRRCP
jgi:hypothetical protein